MEVTLHGVHGVCVASHVDLDISCALEHVPIPRQNMEDEHVIDWDELQNGGGATQFLIVRVKNNYFYFSRGID